MEYCELGSIDSIWAKYPNVYLNEYQIHFILRETIDSLIYLHEEINVIHRDLKASNILLTSRGDIKLIDFNVSALNPHHSCRRNTFIGTPYFMSPDVIACETDKRCDYDYKTDIWSLGITGIELAEQDPPLNHIPPQRVLLRIHKGTQPDFKYPEKRSKEFLDFTNVCLRRNSFERYSARLLLSVKFSFNA
jgi:serine/threonine protein kinase